MSCQTPGQSFGFTPYEAPQDTLEQLEQFQSAKLRARAASRPPGVPLRREVLPAKPSCSHCNDKQMVELGELPDGRPRLVLCQRCHPPYSIESISAEVIENDLIANDRATTEDDIDEACPIAGIDMDPDGLADAAWERLPEPTRVGLTRYIEHRMAPGGYLRAFLEGDRATARVLATPGSMLARIDLAYWIFSYAPRESFGSVDAVTAWLGGAK